MSISKQIKRLFTPGLHKTLVRASKQGKKRFLVVWNRGLGDIALGLFAFVDRVRQYIPDADITFLTRPDLEEGLGLLEGVNVIVVPFWKREDGTPSGSLTKKILKMIGINYKDYDLILNKIDPSGELRDSHGKLIPRLLWRSESDLLYRKYNLPSRAQHSTEHQIIGVHVNTETQQFYGYRKDWPEEKWKRLFERLSEKGTTVILLFGLNKKESFDLPNIVDLRGKTNLLEMLSIIKNCCNILITPDSGVLSIIYYLDVFFPITLISLWGDANQGIMKQAVPAPNKGLLHVPIIGKGKDTSNISVEEVLHKLHKQ